MDDCGRLELRPARTRFDSLSKGDQRKKYTTSQGSSIDYAVVCEALQAHTQIQVDWNVPFKPHAALRYVLQKNSLTLPVTQLTTFQMEPVESLMRPAEPQPCESIEALFATVTDHDRRR